MQTAPRSVAPGSPEHRRNVAVGGVAALLLLAALAAAWMVGRPGVPADVLDEALQRSTAERDALRAERDALRARVDAATALTFDGELLLLRAGDALEVRIDDATRVVLPTGAMLVLRLANGEASWSVVDAALRPLRNGRTPATRGDAPAPASGTLRLPASVRLAGWSVPQLLVWPAGAKPPSDAAPFVVAPRASE